MKHSLKEWDCSTLTPQLTSRLDPFNPIPLFLVHFLVVLPLNDPLCSQHQEIGDFEGVSYSRWDNFFLRKGLFWVDYGINQDFGWDSHAPLGCWYMDLEQTWGSFVYWWRKNPPIVPVYSSNYLSSTSQWTHQQPGMWWHRGQWLDTSLLPDQGTGRSHGCSSGSTGGYQHDHDMLWRCPSTSKIISHPIPETSCCSQEGARVLDHSTVDVSPHPGTSMTFQLLLKASGSDVTWLFLITMSLLAAPL